MPRLVPLSDGPPPSPDSTYLERVAKYIPGEVIAAFKACFAIINTQPASAAQCIVGWFVFGFFFIATPVYLYYMNLQSRTPLGGRPLIIQLLIATFSYLVWSYALGGPFALHDWYKEYEFVGGIFLILFTFSVGIYKPTQGP